MARAGVGPEAFSGERVKLIDPDPIAAVSKALEQQDVSTPRRGCDRLPNHCTYHSYRARLDPNRHHRAGLVGDALP